MCLRLSLGSGEVKRFNSSGQYAVFPWAKVGAGRWRGRQKMAGWKRKSPRRERWIESWLGDGCGKVRAAQTPGSVLMGTHDAG